MNIYYGNESVDKEKFIFESIDPDRKTIVLVPDQFSLQMERDALKYYKEKEGRSALLNLMITDFSALGYKVVNDAGVQVPDLIDKEGRHMLLATIINRMDNLMVYKTMKGRNTFTELVNQTISEMKRYGVSASKLRTVLDSGKIRSSYLKSKLEDVEKIFQEYEAAIQDKYLDSEDYVKFYGELMAKSPLVYGADIWIYGFDTFTPINMELIEKLAMGADQMNIVMTYEEDSPAKASDARTILVGGGTGLFTLTGSVIRQLKHMADNMGEKVTMKKITGFQDENVWVEDASNMVARDAANIYEEAELAAAYIMKLVREEEYRFSEVVVLCNDMDVRGKILGRTLSRWGIPAFVDKKRKMLHHPLVGFLVSLLDILAKGYNSDSVMGMVKSGLMNCSDEDESDLELYTTQYRIRGAKWKEEFTLGRDEWPPEKLKRLNEIRSFIVITVERMKDEMGRRNKASEKVAGLYRFLQQEYGIKQRVEVLVEKQQEMNLLEGAAETAQSWNAICSLLEQIINILGDAQLSYEELKVLLEAGLGSMEIGLVPATNDCVIIGTMQRTRLSGAKAVLIVGANEGVLPREGVSQGLLTEGELNALESIDFSITRSEDVTRSEEQMALYRMLSLPKKKLYMSCSHSNEKGEKILPSRIFTNFEKICGGPKSVDVTDGGRGCISYLSEAMRNFMESGNISDKWLQAINWYAREDEEEFRKICKGMDYSNKVEKLNKDLAEAIFCKDDNLLSLSASRLEKYTSCPFAHFMEYGLRAKENRVFQVDSREIGNVYHDCIMLLSEKLTKEKRWDSISEEEAREMVRDIITSDMKGVSGKLSDDAFSQDKEGQFRLNRILEICGDVAWGLIGQVRAGQIKDMKFEEGFEIRLGGESNGIIHGRIDRMDIINSSEGDAVRIIDYKTGNVGIDLDYFESGYKLQLMIYMNAAKSIGQELIPAGVFYFNIDDKDFDLDSMSTSKGVESALSKKISESYRLQGIVVDDIQTMKGMDENIDKSDVLPIRMTKEGLTARSGSLLLDRDSFDKLCEKTEENIVRFCKEIRSGNIEIAPKKEKKSGLDGVRTSCTYCRFKSICMFDTSFEDCKYINL